MPIRRPLSHQEPGKDADRTLLIAPELFKDVKFTAHLSAPHAVRLGGRRKQKINTQDGDQESEYLQNSRYQF